MPSLTAASASGEGGNIVLKTQDLQLRHSSSITTTAGTQSSIGNGGNPSGSQSRHEGNPPAALSHLTIYADTITQLENSDITANAVKGRGGNININNQGSFRSIDSDITASSQLGISGVVNITTPDINQENSLNQQPSNFITTESVVASSCLARRNASLGSFVVTGNGGLPETPDSTLMSYELVQLISVTNNTALVAPAPLNTTERWKLGDPIMEAKGLLVNSDGRILLVTTADNQPSPPQNLTCQ